MEYISVKEFLNQSKEVQKVLLDWWQPGVGDIYCNLYNGQKNNVLVINKCQFNFKTFKSDIKRYGIPLLTEGQLRKFIEDKTDAFMDIVIEDYEKEYDKFLFRIEFWNNVKITKCWDGNSSLMLWSKDLLQLYFKIAIEIIERSF